MGHSRFGTLADMPRWRNVVRLIAGSASVAIVADMTMDAAHRGLELADGARSSNRHSGFSRRALLSHARTIAERLWSTSAVSCPRSRWT